VKKVVKTLAKGVHHVHRFLVGSVDAHWCSNETTHPEHVNLCQLQEILLQLVSRLTVKRHNSAQVLPLFILERAPHEVTQFSF
jgi:hypothetical protein